jgi:hypothetical protein
MPINKDELRRRRASDQQLFWQTRSRSGWIGNPPLTTQVRMCLRGKRDDRQYRPADEKTPKHSTVHGSILIALRLQRSISHS